MKDFSEFQSFLMENVSKVQYDTAEIFKNIKIKEGISLSQDDIELITMISQQNCLAILRQYHEWQKQPHP